jgi:hypothetical protein
MKLNNVLFVSLVIALFAGCEEPIRQKECWVIVLKNADGLALLLNAKRGSLNALEILLNRSVGLPVRQSEVQLKQEEYVVTLNL